MSFLVVSKARAARFNSICRGFVPLAPSFLLASQAVVQLIVSEGRIRSTSPRVKTKSRRIVVVGE